ncbi:MAG: Ig-like domain-containing protein [Gammaproteobacteria bacterium]|jgi:uncharacterized protein YjdB
MMKRCYGYCLLFLLLVSISGCESGDSTALEQAISVADLNIASITVEPANGTIKAGYDYPFTATGTRPDSSTVDITDRVTWHSSDTSVATVNSSGLVDTKDGVDGGVTISATLASISGSTSLTASTAALSSISITPDPATISACGQLQLTAIGTYADGERTVIPITRFVNWQVTAGNGDISSQGLVTASADSGTISVQADLDGITISTDINITSDLSSITITPATPTINLGNKLQFTATGTYSDSSTANITQRVGWSSSDISVATVNANTGLATAVDGGATDISAVCGSGISGSTTLTVSNEVLDYLRFQDQNDTTLKVLNINVGDVVQIDLEAFFTNGTHRTVTESATWSTLDNSSGIATVNNLSGDKGVITGQTIGEHALIEAIYNNREKILVVNVR